MKSSPHHAEEGLLRAFRERVLEVRVRLLLLLQFSLHFRRAGRARGEVIRYVRVIAAEDVRRPIEEASRVGASGAVNAGEAGKAEVEGAARAVAGVVQVARAALAYGKVAEEQESE